MKFFLEIYMYVCICNGVTDTQIEAAVDNGAETMRDLSNDLNIGSQCGKCCQCAKRVMNKRLLQIAEPQLQVA
jgi:bacterioferritin-associated ferredoxin